MADANRRGVQTNLYLPGAPGCHCVAGRNQPPWMRLRHRAIAANDGECHQSAESNGVVVEMVPSGGSLSIMQIRNPTSQPMAAYISSSCERGAGLLNFRAQTGESLEVGEARVPAASFAHEGAATRLVDCITFVVTIDGASIAQLCDTDPQPFASGAATVSLQTIPFETNPLAGSGGSDRAAPPHELCFSHFPLPSPGAYLCTQGCGGMLTHYFSESFHAFDLRCDEGTPLLSMADGVVSLLVDTATASGIHCDNLYRWNAVGVTTSAGVTILYVHIQPGSALVQKGDSVSAGQSICRSGSIGFSPEPHVHIEAHRTDEDGNASGGPSVPLFLLTQRRSDGALPVPYIPEAGRYYDASGEVPKPS